MKGSCLPMSKDLMVDKKAHVHEIKVGYIYFKKCSELLLRTLYIIGTLTYFDQPSKDSKKYKKQTKVFLYDENKIKKYTLTTSFWAFRFV